MTDVALLSHAAPLRAALRQEFKLRDSYMSLPAISTAKPKVAAEPQSARPSAQPALELKELLLQSAQLLELYTVIAAFVEAVTEMSSELGVHLDQLDSVALLERTKLIAKLSPSEVLAQNGEVLETVVGSTAPPPSTGGPMPAMDAVVMSARAYLAACPIERLEQWANHIEEVELSHRCRHAYETLYLLAHRNDADLTPRFKVLGRAYSQGRISVAEIAGTFELPTWDVVALLESHGYTRPVDVLTLSNEKRAEYLGMLRTARVTRSIQPKDDTVARHVIASQRIEGVDARPWLQVKSQS